jgi:hypothetical protein
MSDADSDPDSISGSSNAHAYADIAIFQAFMENTSVKHIDCSMLFRLRNTKGTALAVAEYVEFSKTLQTLYLGDNRYHYSHEASEMISLVLRALSRNTSVTKLIINTDTIRLASVAFREFLTCTQTLQKMDVIYGRNEEFDEEWYEYADAEGFDEVDTDAIASGFANNTTLSDLEFQGWREADLAPVLTALQDHPALQKIHFGASEKSVDYLPSLSGLEVLLRSQDSKVKELILERVNTDTVGLHPVLQELGRNTKVTALSVRYSELTRENVQQVKSMLRQNTALQYLDLTLCALGSAGLAEIAPVLYRNTSIKTLDLSRNGIDDIESANVLRELLRRNKTITDICLAENDFGRNAAAARSILEGLRSNTALQ